jgi:hypothetical protein
VLIGSLVLLPILVAFGWYVSFRISNSKAVHRLEAQARENGEPLTLAALAAAYSPVPDNENVAVPLLELWEKEDPIFWKAFRRGDTPLPDRAKPTTDRPLPFVGPQVKSVGRTESLSAEQRAAAQRFLESQAEHLPVLRAALQRPRCRFPVRLTDGYEALMPYLPAMREEVHRLRLHGLIALEHGDLSTAMADLEDMFRVCRAVGEGVTLIDQLIRISCTMLALTELERLFSRQELTAGQLGQIRDWLEASERPGAFREVLKCERAMALSIFQMSGAELARMSAKDDEEANDAASVEFGRGIMVASGMAADDRRLMLETFDTALRLAEKEAWLELEALFVRVGKTARRFPPRIFSGIVLPGLGRAAIKFAALEARRRAALVAVAVEEHRLGHEGELPTGLQELRSDRLPMIPADPFDGDQPLRFQRRHAGYVIYSVGHNRRDDRGREQGSGGDQAGFDETFTVER